MDATEYLKTKYGSGSPKIISGLFRKDLYEVFAELEFKTGCEVGVFRGRNAREMFRHIPGLKLYGVEPFGDQPSSTRHKNAPRYERNRNACANRLRGLNVTLIEKFSEIAVQDIPYDSLDFVYIDGDHSYDYAMLDIILWTRRVRPGGIVSGHDYIGPGDYNHAFDVNVKEAVDDYIKIHKINNWYLTDKIGAINKSDRCPSWFFVK
jgi:predicted O-methyltransferase YrrM